LVEDADGKRSQQLQLDGERIYTEVSDGKKTSTIVQGPDIVEIQCGTFRLQADTIDCRATREIEHHSDGTLKLDSSGDSTIKSAAGLTLEASGKALLKGSKLTLDGGASAELQAAQVKIAGKATLALEAAQIQIAAKAKVDVSGPIGSFAGTAQTAIGGGAVTQLKGGIVQLQGVLKMG
ncbi:MAG: hypothetical protein D6776_08790, partial [Planctomycetota bacterium]